MRHLNSSGRARTFVGAATLALTLVGGAGGALAKDRTPVSPSGLALGPERPFLDENASSMDKMMNAMDVKPTGDVDRDFVASMVPHHQGAVDMAQSYLRYGHNEQLRRIAQAIIVEQPQEIAAMSLAIGSATPVAEPSSSGIVLSPGASARVPHR